MLGAQLQPLLAQRFEQRRVGVAHGQVLEHDAHVVELAHHAHLGRVRAHAAGAVADDVPVALQPPQRLAHGRPGRVEALGELLLDQPLPVRERAREQRGAQLACGLPQLASRACTARSKAASGGWVTPPPIWPMPGCGGRCRCARAARCAWRRPCGRRCRGSPRARRGSACPATRRPRSPAVRRRSPRSSAGVDPDRRRADRRAGDGQRAEPVGLDDRGVAEVRVHVGGRVAVEQGRRVGQRGRADEPLVAGAGDADADLDAVAGDRGEDRRARHVGRAVQGQLGEDHRQVQEELAVAGDEGAHLGMLDAERLERQRRALLGAVVRLVAALERLDVQRRAGRAG